ncbi:hypothetical protein PF003_g24491 [Phytophthora fragariae]|nr:hypothetical protein PF003_g24491 [Phytophthora fragariae]
MEQLFQQFSKPQFWIFPPSERVPPARSWSPALITEDNVKALYNSTPWRVLDTLVTPVSFGLVGWFEQMARKYAQLEEDYR